LPGRSKLKENRSLLMGHGKPGKPFCCKNCWGVSSLHVLRLDFLENPEFAAAFAGSISPKEAILNIELLTGKIFNPETDLLIPMNLVSVSELSPH
jgi:hypothetical protein